MKVTVEYAAQVKRVAGTREETFEFGDACTLQSVLDRIVETHGEPMREILLDEENTLHPSILVFVGDTQIREDFDRKLNEGERITVLSPISGG